MKTLKQIREEYDNNFLNGEVVSLEENIDVTPKAKIPSNKEMPTMLIFRRITFRTYPRGQVIALYYSKMVDKYLSIPFGPGGNLNLSESQVYDTLEELEEGAKWEALKGAVKGGIAGAVGGPAGALRGAIAGGTTGYIKGKYDQMKKDLRKSKDQPEAEKPSSSEKAPETTYGGFKRSLPKTKTGSVSSHGSSDATYQSKIKQAELKRAYNPSVNENKISDIRTMIKENIDSKDITINGRTITLNNSMAKRILEVYDSVNTKNKRIVESMLNEDLESFKKLLNFSIRN